MIVLSAQQKFLTLTLIWGTGICGMLTGLATCAAAAPVTYTGFTITDGKLGAWEFRDGTVVFSVNLGVFWSEVGARSDGD